MPNQYHIQLTEQQKAEIASSKKEIAVSGLKENDVFDKEIKQWFNFNDHWDNRQHPGKLII